MLPISETEPKLGQGLKPLEFFVHLFCNWTTSLIYLRFASGTCS